MAPLQYSLSLFISSFLRDITCSKSSILFLRILLSLAIVQVASLRLLSAIVVISMVESLFLAVLDISCSIFWMASILICIKWSNRLCSSSSSKFSAQSYSFRSICWLSSCESTYLLRVYLYCGRLKESIQIIIIIHQRLFQHIPSFLWGSKFHIVSTQMMTSPNVIICRYLSQNTVLKTIIQFSLYKQSRMTQVGSSRKMSVRTQEMYIFSCQAYRLRDDEWVKLQKCQIDDGFDDKNVKQVSKVKVKGNKGHENTYQIKIIINGKDVFYSMTQELQLQWLTHVINLKIKEEAREALHTEPYANVCCGTAYKKSFLGEWERCFVTISQDGLTVAKQEEGKPELTIEGVKEIWTRFQMIGRDSNSYFVFKLRSFFKYEFGVPVDMINKWTKAFYSLISFD